MVERERDGGVEEEKGETSLISLILTCSWNEKGNVSLVVYLFLFFFFYLLSRYARKRIIIELNVSF